MSSSKPLISLCIPTYNRAKFLLLALNSCFSQTYKNFEIIISDNSDTEETKKTLLKIKDKRIRYYKNKKNIGSFNNLIKLTKLVKGKYVKFLLDDDLLAKNCLEEMVKVLETHTNVGLVCAPLQIIDNKGDIVTPRFYLIKKMRDLYRYKKASMLLSKESVLKDFLTKKYPCCVPTGIMFRKKCIDEVGTFDKNFTYITDIEFCMRVATKYDFYYINKYLSFWRHTPSSETISILHTKGANSTMFYDLAKKYITNNSIMNIFPFNQRKSIIKASYLFSSKRTTLNFVAGMKSCNLKAMIETLKLIAKNDPYVSNKIKLPFVMLGEIISAIVQNVKLHYQIR